MVGWPSEAGNSLKAADSAIKAKEWDRALQILNVIADHDAAAKFFGKIAEHFETTGEYEQAEKYYIDAGRAKDALEMYNKAARWADAYKLAAEFLGADQTHEMYLQKAEELEQSGRLKEAEQLYISFGEPAKAIAMYKEANRTDEMMKNTSRTSLVNNPNPETQK
uniref:Tetratricopeptide repeat protein n=1 Tax=Panagrolaimus davidi TaxID=227884 RepID=A0A914P8W8_9BILA